MTENPSPKPIVMWFRQDLRLRDNPALVHAAETKKPIIFLFVLDEVSDGVRPYGAAQKWWLHHSLVSLSEDIERLGGKLTLRSGPAEQIIDEIAKTSGADKIVWNRRYGEGEQSVDRAVKRNFDGEAKSFAGVLMHEPTQVRTGADKPYKVYTPFWRKFNELAPPRKPLSAPLKLSGSNFGHECEELSSWKLLPSKPDWAVGLRDHWTPGEQGAQSRLDAFLNSNLDSYAEGRDFPAKEINSDLSPHLRFGEISPHQLWHATLSDGQKAQSKARETWRKQLVWREFSYHLLQEWPDLATRNFNPKFDGFPWEENEQFLEAWKKGATGYPIVDAGMRQLWQTGTMHNRVRMIVGSFLIKHLLIDWRQGEQWFWDTLVDGDPANNPAQWQWVAGSGADAAPYFRIFNPIMQAEKFDPDGIYIKKFVPELAHLPAKFLPAPWEAPSGELLSAGVKLGETYPNPIVDHKAAREKALDALNSMKAETEE